MFFPRFFHFETISILKLSNSRNNNMLCCYIGLDFNAFASDTFYCMLVMMKRKAQPITEMIYKLSVTPEIYCICC